MKFVRKPTLVDAEQFTGKVPYPKGVCIKPCLDGNWVKPHVHTAHDNQAVILAPGDWILPESDGAHFYPCKPDIFAATYDKVFEPIT